MMVSLRWLGLLSIWISAAYVSAEDLQPVEANIAVEKAWVGQRIPFRVVLRAKGSFEGAPSFSMPQIPQTVIVKIGSPTVSSEQHDDETWFAQSHTFAIFSQAAGTLTIPAFPVRFSHHEGFTGPVQDEEHQVPEVTVVVEDPPGRPSDQFIVSTNQLEIAETWKPQPGKFKQGDIVARTITQTAKNMTGMALAPPMENAPSSVSLYPSSPSVHDKTDRGDLVGQRIDTLKYRFDQPGTVIIPESTYTWWDPDKKQFGKKTLPAATFEVEAVLQTTMAGSPASENGWRWLALLLLLLGTVGILFWQREWLFDRYRKLHAVIYPPHKVAAKKLLRACQRSDLVEAEHAWAEWQNLQEASFTPSSDLAAAVHELHAARYGNGSSSDWSGEALSRAFRLQLTEGKQKRRQHENALPPMNV